MESQVRYDFFGVPSRSLPQGSKYPNRKYLLQTMIAIPGVENQHTSYLDTLDTEGYKGVTTNFYTTRLALVRTPHAAYSLVALL